MGSVRLGGLGGAERRANTARVMGAVCTWVIPAKNICIKGARRMKASSDRHMAGAAEAAAPDPALSALPLRFETLPGLFSRRASATTPGPLKPD